MKRMHYLGCRVGRSAGGGQAIRRVMAILLVVGLWLAPAQAGSIVHPWRAAPRMVAVGESFPVMFQATPDEKVTGVTLRGPFQQIDIPPKDVRMTRGEFRYDPVLDARYTLRIDVTVPADCPADVYDLVVRTNRREALSKKSVGVIRGYRKRYTIVHITDAHVARNWTGDLKTGHPPVLEHVAQLIDVVNIIGPEFVVHTGDAITNFNRSPDQAEPDAVRKWECFWDGTGKWRGMHGFDAPAFNVAGNHDHFDAPDDNRARQYVEFNGLRTYGFVYGTSRFMALDDSLGQFKTDPAPQFKAVEAFLAEAGPGQFRVLMHHQPKLAPTAFLDKHGIQLDLAGHTHRNKDYNVGATPTRLLITKNAGRVLEDDPGWFRVLTIEGDKIVANASLRYGDNTTQTPRLKLAFAAANNGTARANTATITNGFDEAFPACHVRFVMKRGAYTVAGGIVEQTYSTDKVTVCDVRVAVAARSKATVAIRAR